MKRALPGQEHPGSGFDLELHLHLSAGRYICGEETALLNALEGKRGNPRAKPPFPTVAGGFGGPTTSTMSRPCACFAHRHPRRRLVQAAGPRRRGGTKLFGASGKVRRPGLWELPMGTPVREILEEHAGGMREGFSSAACSPAEPPPTSWWKNILTSPMDFTSVQKAGSRMGTGTMIVLDDRTCPVGMVRNLEHFFAQESCGWCTPCWSGLGWAERILEAMEEGRGAARRPGEARVRRVLAPGNTFCALAPGAAEPLQSALKYFRDDFERHIREQRCPWR